MNVYAALRTGGLRGGALLTSFGLSVLLARKYSAAGAGEYFSIMGLASIVSAFTMRGADQLLVREIGLSFAADHRSVFLETIVRRTASLVGLWFRSSANALLIILCSLAFSWIESPTRFLGLAAGALALLVTQFASSLAQGLGHSSSALVLQNALLPLVTITFISLFDSLSIVVILIISAIAATGLALVYVINKINLEDIELKKVNSLVKTKTNDSADIFESAMSFFWLTVGNQAIIWSPILVLYFTGDQAGAGIFATAVKFSNLIIVGVTVANVLITQSLAKSVKQKDRSAMRHAVSEATLISVVLGVAPLCLLLFASKEVASLLGPSFDTVSSILKVLLVSQSIMVVVGPSSLVLVMCGKERLMARTSLIVAMMLIAFLPVAKYFGGNHIFTLVYALGISINGLILLLSANSVIEGAREISAQPADVQVK